MNVPGFGKIIYVVVLDLRIGVQSVQVMTSSKIQAIDNKYASAAAAVRFIDYSISQFYRRRQPPA